jgi:hypothetical protein
MMFEAKVSDAVSDHGINKGRVVILCVEGKFYTEDDSFTAHIAHFCDGEWLVRPSNTDIKKSIEALVSHLETLPLHGELETEKQTA